MYTDLIEAFYVEEILKKKSSITPELAESLIGDFANLYTAGTDTTSHSLQMGLYYAFAQTSISQKIREEI